MSRSGYKVENVSSDFYTTFSDFLFRPFPRIVQLLAID